MSIEKADTFRYFFAATFAAVTLLLTAPQIRSATTEGESFSSPEEAAQTLVKAAEARDLAAVLRILGPSAREIVETGDKVADMKARDRFLTKAKEKMLVTGDPKHPGVKVIEIGTARWPFPIPLVRTGDRWRFDAGRGKREILLRRIGENELTVIDVCRGYVEAQNQYFEQSRSTQDVPQYAQRFMSSAGRRDGLYWKGDEQNGDSPLGESVARAISEGYLTSKTQPYHGYRFKILKDQGSHAPGGAVSYMDGDAMTRGFALIAWPSDYRSTGVMTFVVDRAGIVYQKDLGRNTASIVSEITAYDPDASWTPVAGSGVRERNRPGVTISRATR